MEYLAARLAQIPGVVAVSLGGSRARGEADRNSDWDFGLYYRGSQGSIDPADVKALGWPGEVSAPGAWGPVVNGGAWLTVDGRRIDLCYRDLDEVLETVAAAEKGLFEIHALATFVGGIPSYVVAGELAIGKQLSGSLPRPQYPPALAVTAPPRWRQLSKMALLMAGAHAKRGDAVATAANLGVAIVTEAQGRLAEQRVWVLTEKGIVDRAGLSDTQPLLAEPGATPESLETTVSAVAAVLAAPAR